MQSPMNVDLNLPEDRVADCPSSGVGSTAKWRWSPGFPQTMPAAPASAIGWPWATNSPGETEAEL
jgi:hypothetical protein